jgi:hypothetical protein
MSVTDDQIRSRGKEQYTDHSSQGKKEGNASQRVCLFRRVFTLIIETSCSWLFSFSPYPLPLTLSSVHILHTSLHSGGRLFYITCLSIQLPLPFHVVDYRLFLFISYRLAYQYQSKSTILYLHLFDLSVWYRYISIILYHVAKPSILD